MNDFNRIIDHIPIKKETKKLYHKLEMKKDRISRFKFGMIFIYIGFVVTIFLFEKKHKITFIPSNLSMLSISQIVVAFVLAWLIYVFLTYFVRKDIYKKVTGREGVSREWKKDYKSLLILIISPDYYWAKYFKCQLIMEEKQFSKSYFLHCRARKLSLHSWDRIKIFHKFYIIQSNWINLIISIILLITITVISYINYLYIEPLPKISCCYLVADIYLLLDCAGCVLYPFLNGGALFIVFFRVISRTFEVCRSFYRDITNSNDKVFSNHSPKSRVYSTVRYQNTNKEIYIHNWKDSYLLKGDRLSLAFHSILEITVLYHIIYFVFSKVNNGLLFTKSFLDSLIISIMNNQLEKIDHTNVIQVIFEIIHSITILTLIVISIASYIGSGKVLTNREKELYLYHSERRGEK